MKILVLEDSNTTQCLLNTLLAEHDLTPAYTFAEAQAAAAADRFDAAIVDLNLPDADQTTLTHWLRDLKTTTPVILHTEIQDDELCQFAVTLGVQFVPKQDTSHRLTAAVHALQVGEYRDAQQTEHLVHEYLGGDHQRDSVDYHRGRRRVLPSYS